MYKCLLKTLDGLLIEIIKFHWIDKDNIYNEHKWNKIVSLN